MPVKPVPDGYHSVQPYLIFDGAAKAIEFYRQAFGASETLCMKGPDGRIGHAELQIGDSIIMMADENPQMQAFAPPHYGGSSVSLLIYTEDCDAMYKHAVAAGAKGMREPADQFYGDRMAGVEDPFRLQMVHRHAHQGRLERRVGAATLNRSALTAPRRFEVFFDFFECLPFRLRQEEGDGQQVEHGASCE